MLTETATKAYSQDHTVVTPMLMMLQVYSEAFASCTHVTTITRGGKESKISREVRLSELWRMQAASCVRAKVAYSNDFDEERLRHSNHCEVLMNPPARTQFTSAYTQTLLCH